MAPKEKKEKKEKVSRAARKEAKAAAAAGGAGKKEDGKDIGVESVAEDLRKLAMDPNRNATGVLTSQRDSRDVSCCSVSNGLIVHDRDEG
jgi:hypothetical protein